MRSVSELQQEVQDYRGKLITRIIEFFLSDDAEKEIVSAMKEGECSVSLTYPDDVDMLNIEDDVLAELTKTMGPLGYFVSINTECSYFSLTISWNTNKVQEEKASIDWRTLPEGATLVYEFRSAPKELQELSSSGGDEEWIVIGNSLIAERLDFCEKQHIEVEGKDVYIIAH